MPEESIIRLGTRGSLLARTQSQLVADDLMRRHPGVRVELTIIKTSGDAITERPLHEFGGKGLFTKELEQALLAKQVDFAVHSFKDMPTTMPLVEQSNLIIAAAPAREDPRDALAAGSIRTIDELPNGARVGTGSLRRRCQLLARRPDLKMEPIRGNIDTRLRKLREGQFNAVVLAMAGLRRAKLFDPAAMVPIAADILLPAPGQGALALQCRRDDIRTRHLLEALDDPATARCVAAERLLVELLQGDCLSPIAALAVENSGSLSLRAVIGSKGGHPPLAKAHASGADPQSLARVVFQQLEQQRAMKLLHGS